MNPLARRHLIPAALVTLGFLFAYLIFKPILDQLITPLRYVGILFAAVFTSALLCGFCKRKDTILSDLGYAFAACNLSIVLFVFVSTVISPGPDAILETLGKSVVVFAVTYMGTGYVIAVATLLSFGLLQGYRRFLGPAA